MTNTLTYKGYLGSISFSAEDNLLIGSVVGIQDSLNFHGTSIEEVTQSFHDCIDGYLEMCEAFGRRPDKVYKGSFNVRISPRLHQQVAQAAEKSGLSLNQFVQQALEEKVNPPDQKKVVSILQEVQQTSSVYAVKEYDYTGRYRHAASGHLS